ncbi:unnamed protein product [Blumeria hordei]|uniref:SP-RING-type domain-containing protein n=1 Tax=Blumeria hordei TaxID=2867405 RepID=A0A383USD7_BLUHO|nr:unnamed protein product [Blumeria hordei]
MGGARTAPEKLHERDIDNSNATLNTLFGAARQKSWMVGGTTPVRPTPRTPVTKSTITQVAQPQKIIAPLPTEKSTSLTSSKRRPAAIKCTKTVTVSPKSKATGDSSLTEEIQSNEENLGINVSQSSNLTSEEAQKVTRETQDIQKLQEDPQPEDTQIPQEVQQPQKAQDVLQIPEVQGFQEAQKTQNAHQVKQSLEIQRSQEVQQLQEAQNLLESQRSEDSQKTKEVQEIRESQKSDELRESQEVELPQEIQSSIENPLTHEAQGIQLSQETLQPQEVRQLEEQSTQEPPEILQSQETPGIQLPQEISQSEDVQNLQEAQQTQQNQKSQELQQTQETQQPQETQHFQGVQQLQEKSPQEVQETQKDQEPREVQLSQETWETRELPEIQPVPKGADTQSLLAAVNSTDTIFQRSDSIQPSSYSNRHTDSSAEIALARNADVMTPMLQTGRAIEIQPTQSQPLSLATFQSTREFLTSEAPLTSPFSTDYYHTTQGESSNLYNSSGTDSEQLSMSTGFMGDQNSIRASHLSPTILTTPNSPTPQMQRNTHNTASLVNENNSQIQSNQDTMIYSIKGGLAMIEAQLKSVGGLESLNIGLERPRFQLLTEACNADDLFYVILHQLFVIWDSKPQEVLSIPNVPDAKILQAGFVIIGKLIHENDQLAPNHRRWFSGFPIPLLDLWKNSDRCRRTLVDVFICIEKLTNHWYNSMYDCKTRGCPFLVDELVSKLGILSPIFQGVLFTATRRNMGIQGEDAIKAMEQVFKRDQTEHQNLMARLSTTNPPTVKEVHDRNNALIITYQKLCNRFQKHASPHINNTSMPVASSGMSGPLNLPQPQVDSPISWPPHVSNLNPWHTSNQHHRSMGISQSSNSPPHNTIVGIESVNRASHQSQPIPLNVQQSPISSSDQQYGQINTTVRNNGQASQIISTTSPFTSTPSHGVIPQSNNRRPFEAQPLLTTYQQQPSQGASTGTNWQSFGPQQRRLSFQQQKAQHHSQYIQKPNNPQNPQHPQHPQHPQYPQYPQNSQHPQYPTNSQYPQNSHHRQTSQHPPNSQNPHRPQHAQRPQQSLHPQYNQGNIQAQVQVQRQQQYSQNMQENIQSQIQLQRQQQQLLARQQILTPNRSSNSGNQVAIHNGGQNESVTRSNASSSVSTGNLQHSDTMRTNNISGNGLRIQGTNQQTIPQAYLNSMPALSFYHNLSDKIKNDIHVYQKTPALNRSIVPPQNWLHPPSMTSINRPELNALHQALLYSPLLVPANFTSTEEKQKDSTYRHYQAVKYLAILPTNITNRPISRLEFTVPKADICKIPVDVKSVGGNLPTRKFEKGTLQYRIRCAQMRRTETNILESDWMVRETSWPETACLDINSIQLEPRRKIHHGRDLPIDITQYVLQHGVESANVITVSMIQGRCEYNYFLAVEVVEILEHSQILDMCKEINRLPASHTLGKIMKSLGPQPSESHDDIEVVTSEISINLSDPFTSCIFELPVRGKECLHRECFDLETFLLTRTSKAKRPSQPCMVDVWKCPLCGQDARPWNLQIDGYLETVRKEIAAQGNLDIVKSIRVKPDGTWYPKIEKSKASSDSQEKNDSSDGESTISFKARQKKMIEVICLDDE